jgi:hypothetical protein
MISHFPFCEQEETREQEKGIIVANGFPSHNDDESGPN